MEECHIPVLCQQFLGKGCFPRLHCGSEPWEPLRPRVPLGVHSELEWGDHRFPDILSPCHNLA